MSFLSQPITLQSLFGPKRVIVGGPDINVVISESTSDVLTITKQPVQQGASITDHAYKEPTVFTMVALFQNNSLISSLLSTFTGGGLNAIYQELLTLQTSRAPFDVLTPKRIYKSMLMATLSQVTDKLTENILSVTMTFQQIVIVSVGTIQIDPSKLKNPGSNAATLPSGPKSILASTAQGVQALVGR